MMILMQLLLLLETLKLLPIIPARDVAKKERLTNVGTFFACVSVSVHI